MTTPRDRTGAASSEVTPTASAQRRWSGEPSQARSGPRGSDRVGNWASTDVAPCTQRVTGCAGPKVNRSGAEGDGASPGPERITDRRPEMAVALAAGGSTR